MVRAVGGAAGRVGDLDSGLFSAQRMELSQSRFSKGSAETPGAGWVQLLVGGYRCRDVHLLRARLILEPCVQGNGGSCLALSRGGTRMIRGMEPALL